MVIVGARAGGSAESKNALQQVDIQESIILLATSVGLDSILGIRIARAVNTLFVESVSNRGGSVEGVKAGSSALITGGAVHADAEVTTGQNASAVSGGLDECRLSGSNVHRRPV